MKRATAVLALFVASLALAGTMVDQGNGGVQPWTVKCTNCASGSNDGGTNDVIIGTSLTTDGGTTLVPVRVDLTGAVAMSYTCFSPVNTVVAVGTSAAPTPATALASRRFAQVCNDPRNTSSSFLTCSETSTTPSSATGTAGDVLFPADCATYWVSDATIITCISNASGTSALVKQCR